MKFKDIFNFNKKSTFTPLSALPELWGNSYFYNYQQTTQNDQALISMYNQLPEVQAPVNYIIDSLSIIPYDHYRVLGKEDKIVENSKVKEVLETPNQYQTENDFIKMFFLNRIVLGLGYIDRVKPIGFRTVKQLFVLPTQHTEPILEEIDKNDIRLNSIIGYETVLGGTTIKIPEEEVFVQRETSLIDNNYYDARSRLMSAIYTSDSLRNNYEARIKLLKDRGAVGIISPNEPGNTITTDDAEQMRKRYYEQNGITGNKMPFLISPRPLNFTSTSFNSTELQLNDNKTQDFQVICNVLGIDPALFGIGNNTYNNKKLAKTSFYEDVIIPYFDNYLQLLSKVFNLPKNEYLKADYSQIAAMQEDYDKLVTANTKLWNDGLITEKEAREATGYEGGEDKKKSELSENDTNQNE